MPERRRRRLVPLHKLADAGEREAGRRLSQGQRELIENEQRLEELRRFRDGYAEDVATQRSVEPARLQQTRLFLENLEAAVRQQEHVVEASRAAFETLRQNWIGSRRRSKVLDNAMQRLADDARSQRDSREQRAQDDVNQRPRDEET